MTFWAKHKSKFPRLILFGLLLALPFVLLRVQFVRRVLVDLVTYMREVPVGGIAIFLAVETVALMLTTPLWLMSGLAGYAYGFGWGLVLAWPAVTLCACIVFLVGRTFTKRVVSSRTSETHFWRAVNHAVQTNGLEVAFLMRIAVAIPQNIATYMLSATPLKLRDFALGTFCGLLPATTLHVYVGSNVESAAALVSGQNSTRGPLAWVSLAVGLILTVGVVVIASRYARRALDQALAEAARG
jgi:uncharacterized membrane protein YdjX (TVP38/TMEM64 family)